MSQDGASTSHLPTAAGSGDVVSTVVPSSAAECNAAITALESSTKSLETRIRAVEAQNIETEKLAHRRNAVDNQKASHASRLSQRQAAELQHVKFANQQLLENLRAEIQDEATRNTTDTSSLSATTSAALSSDDRVLRELNQTISSAAINAASGPDFEALQDRADKLVRALQLFHAEALKDRLDRTYLESLNALDASGDSSDALLDAPEITLRMVKGDLSSLYSEIDDVAAMVASHQYGSALKTSLQKVLRARTQDKQASFEKIYREMTSMTEALDELSADAEALQSQRHLLNDVRMHIMQLETDKQAPLDAKRRPGYAGSQNNRSAVRALFQHLTSPADSGGLSETTHPFSNVAQLDQYISKLEKQSCEFVARILQTSETTAEKGREAIDHLSSTQETNEQYVHNIRELEEGIATMTTGLAEINSR